MPQAGETFDNPLAASMAAGVDTISQQQVVTFTKYVRLILPLDKWAFWVRADLVNPGALVGGMLYNRARPGQPPSVETSAATMQVKGSLHYTTVNNQDESEGFSVNRVIFTAESDVEELNTVNPKVLYIGEFDGQRFAFSTRSMLYRQAGLYHYRGDAVYPAMADEIIDSIDGFNSREVVVSNSLPIWVGLGQFAPMYPSFLVDDNIVPPWCSVHVSATRALQAAPYIDRQGSHFQLVADKVRLTFYGLRNFSALDFQDYLFQYSLDTDALGIMGSPVMYDEKRTQAELNILAMKKTFEVEVSYYQSRVRDIARQLILHCIPTFTFED